MRAARELRQGFDTSKLKELDAPLRLILAEAQGLGLPVGKVIQAMLGAGARLPSTLAQSLCTTRSAFHYDLLAWGHRELLIAALQRKASTSTTTFVIDELEYRA